jgi:hypothetical protein
MRLIDRAEGRSTEPEADQETKLKADQEES